MLIVEYYVSILYVNKLANSATNDIYLDRYNTQLCGLTVYSCTRLAASGSKISGVRCPTLRNPYLRKIRNV